MNLSDGSNNVLIGAASTKISAHSFLDLFVCKLDRPRFLNYIVCNVAHLAVLCLLHQSHGRADLAWCTKTALKTIVLDERGLHRMKCVSACEAFDCRDFFAFTLCR